MKKIIYTFLILGFTFIGCSDLEEQPVGLLAPDGFFQTTSDIQTAIDGAFTHAINEKFWGRKLSIALMLRSDMVNLLFPQLDHGRPLQDRLASPLFPTEILRDPTFS